MAGHGLPELEEVVESAAICAVAYNSWEKEAAEACPIERSLRQPRTLERPVVERLFKRFRVTARHRFPSGLDAKLFKDQTCNRVVIAADGTDLTGRCRRELRGDLVNCLALVLGRRSPQVEDLLQLLEEVRFRHPDCRIVGVGHSLGGYVQQVAAARRPELVDLTLTFNAPGAWQFSTDIRGCASQRSGGSSPFSPLSRSP